MLILIANIHSMVDKFWHLFIKTYTELYKKLECILAFFKILVLVTIQILEILLN